MGYIPLFMDVSGRPCAVLGDGDAAARRVRELLDAGASVTIVSARPCNSLTAIVAAGRVRHLARPYQPGDLRGCVLAYISDEDSAIARAAAAEARDLGIPVNVADTPDLCTFIAPSVVSRGGLRIAISTGGASPALARSLREQLEARFGPEYETLIEILAAARRFLQRTEAGASARARIMTQLVRSTLVDHLRSGDYAAADRVVTQSLGLGLSALGFDSAQLSDAVAAASAPGVNSK
jgi:precorrin-2 dehydrogenase / sirohydrochlorin ferrochelatase